MSPRLFTLLSLALLSFCSTASANDRRFVYSYETTPLAKGALEFEPWFTYKHLSDANEWEFRYELEYGVTDKLTLAAYLSDWSIVDPKHGKSEASWNTAGIEAIYSLSDPNTDWLGSAIYGEVLIGPETFSIETKLLLQKNFGPIAIVYNAIVEAEWEGSDYQERVGNWENTLGISYSFNPKFSLGFEAVHESSFEDWSGSGNHRFYIGPNVAYRAKNFWATVAGLAQISDVDGEPDAQVRLIMGFKF
jgi:hypothetical protein